MTVYGKLTEMTAEELALTAKCSVEVAEHLRGLSPAAMSARREVCPARMSGGLFSSERECEAQQPRWALCCGCIRQFLESEMPAPECARGRGTPGVDASQGDASRGDESLEDAFFPDDEWDPAYSQEEVWGGGRKNKERRGRTG